MRFIILIFFIMISCGPINIGVRDIPIQSKEIKGYDISYYAKRDKYGVNCKAFISVNRNESQIDNLYVEIQAIGKNKTVLSVAYFLLENIEKNKIIEKNGVFNEIQSCAKVVKLEILGG